MLTDGAGVAFTFTALLAVAPVLSVTVTLYCPEPVGVTFTEMVLPGTALFEGSAHA